MVRVRARGRVRAIVRVRVQKSSLVAMAYEVELVCVARALMGALQEHSWEACIRSMCGSCSKRLSPGGSPIFRTNSRG